METAINYAITSRTEAGVGTFEEFYNSFSAKLMSHITLVMHQATHQAAPSTLFPMGEGDRAAEAMDAVGGMDVISRTQEVVVVEVADKGAVEEVAHLRHPQPYIGLPTIEITAMKNGMP